jgi:hypothetical protein
MQISRTTLVASNFYAPQVAKETDNCANYPAGRQVGVELVAARFRM